MGINIYVKVAEVRYEWLGRIHRALRLHQYFPIKIQSSIIQNQEIKKIIALIYQKLRYNVIEFFDRFDVFSIINNRTIFRFRLSLTSNTISCRNNTKQLSPILNQEIPQNDQFTNQRLKHELFSKDQKSTHLNQSNR